MSKINFLKKLGKYGAVGGIGGAFSSGYTSAAHTRSEDTKKGLFVGAMAGLAAATMPKYIFRKIKGRIIKIKVRT